MLYIYRASAGSGKTFLLAGFYIELLFRKELTPRLEGREMLFNEILAVTFTNKATAEMKLRIIKDLNKLWKDPTSSDYYKKLKQPDSKGEILSDKYIQERAGTILHDMLVDYSSLHISTIDSFFQQVIRSFAHELNLPGNYEIELDADMVLDHAVSQFLLTLDPQRDAMTFRWIEKFSNYRMQNGSHWNIHNELFKLAKVLTSEAYRKVSAKVGEFSADKQQLSDYIKVLDGIKTTWRNDLKRMGNDCLQLISNAGLQPEDFKKGTVSNFTKWANGEAASLSSTLLKCLEDPANLFTKQNAHLLQQLGSNAERLQQLIQEASDLLEGERAVEYNSAVVIGKNIFQLGILSQLENEANKYCAEQGIRLLSNTTQLLNALVAERSTPFIYEKTGTRILSYMIDEFQDTSGMQWENFSPLLEESLGYDSQNLIVGDVKQSIYRWRGSDWELLHSKLKDFVPEQQAIDENGNRLSDNWRSDSKIIRFNNEFFSHASKIFATAEPENKALEEIVRIYSDVEQSISSVRKSQGVAEGLLSFETLPAKEGKEYSEEVAKRLPELVIALQQTEKEPGKLYQPQDILILCRKRAQCHICAQALLDYKQAHPESPYGMDIITQEALLLNKQPVVRALIAALEFLHDPKSDYRRAVVGICWRALSATTINEAISSYFAEPDELHLENLLNIPLYETVERLVALMPESARRETSFIQAFCDVVLSYTTKEGPNLDGFLSWWKTKGDSLSVTTPSNQNAIRIMTIHQSKGLDGEAVIIPFAQESLDIKTSGFNSDLLWCEPDVEPFARPNLVVPIEISSKLSKSIFKKQYDQERIRAIIDNLNTAYVAFTRARHAMIILSPTPPDKGGTSLQSVLQNFFKNLWSSPIDEFKIDEHFDTKQLIGIEPATAEASAPIGQTAKLPLIKQTEYIPPSDSAAARGTTLHAAFSAVIDNTQIDEPITRLFQSGQAELEGYSLPEVLERIHRALESEQAKDWFNPANRVLTEQDIITRSTHTQRPDRIVFTPDGRTIIIDYKTGEEHQSRYNRQVSHYMRLMQKMGFRNVQGYLWYVETDKVVEVTL